LKPLRRTRRNVVPAAAETVRRPVHPIMLNAFVRGLLVGLLPLAGSVAVLAGSPPDAGSPTDSVWFRSLSTGVALEVGSAPDASARLPVIRRQPISQGAYAGDTVTLSVEALPSSLDGAAVLTYQWLAGTNLTPIVNGAYNSTNSTLPQLVLTNVATGYSGPFRVAVSSGTNTVVSEPATLSVVLGVASRLRLGTVSVTTNAAPAAGLKVFFFPGDLVRARSGPRRRRDLDL